MHTVDIVVLCVAGLAVVWFAIILARQRVMLRGAGSIPMAVRSPRAHRWQYGVARFIGDELRWYRSLGLFTRPSRVLHRASLEGLSRRAPQESELSALPEHAVVVSCREGDVEAVLALSESAYTGFVSWLEASAPRT